MLKANHPLKGGRLSRTSTATRLKRSVFGGTNDELSDLEEPEELPAHLSLGQNSKIKRAERQPPQDNPRNPATEGQIGKSSTKASVRHEVLLRLSILNSCQDTVVINLVDDEDEEGPKPRKPERGPKKISKRLVVSDEEEESQEASRNSRRGSKLAKTSTLAASTTLAPSVSSSPIAAARPLPTANSRPKKSDDPHPTARSKRASAVAASAKCAADLIDSDDVSVDGKLKHVTTDAISSDQTADVFGPRVPLRTRDHNASTLVKTTAAPPDESYSGKATSTLGKPSGETEVAKQKKRKDRPTDDHSEGENPREPKRAREEVTEEAGAITKTVSSSVSRPPARYGHRGRKAKASSPDQQHPSDQWDQLPNEKAARETKTARPSTRARPPTKSSKQKENKPAVDVDQQQTRSTAALPASDVSMRYLLFRTAKYRHAQAKVPAKAAGKGRTALKELAGAHAMKAVYFSALIETYGVRYDTAS